MDSYRGQYSLHYQQQHQSHSEVFHNAIPSAHHEFASSAHPTYSNVDSSLYVSQPQANYPSQAIEWSQPDERINSQLHVDYHSYQAPSTPITFQNVDSASMGDSLPLQNLPNHQGPYQYPYDPPSPTHAHHSKVSSSIASYTIPPPEHGHTTGLDLPPSLAGGASHFAVEPDYRDSASGTETPSGLSQDVSHTYPSSMAYVEATQPAVAAFVPKLEVSHELTPPACSLLT